MSNNPYGPSPRDSGVDFGGDSIAPPPGPPPPKVPKGWLARWDDNYKTFYYVNLATKQSQWEPPTEEVVVPSSTNQPQASASTSQSDRPPSYSESTTSRIVEPASLNPRQSGTGSAPHTPGPGSQGSDYLRAPSPQGRSRSHSLGSKISKFIRSHSGTPVLVSGGHSSSRPYYTPPPSQYHGVAYPQRMYHAPMVASGPIMMGGPMGMGGRRRGLGPGGMMGLGLGGGLLGGMMLQDAIHDGQQDAYQDGFEDGADFDDGGFDGGDFGDFGDF